VRTDWTSVMVELNRPPLTDADDQALSSLMNFSNDHLTLQGWSGEEGGGPMTLTFIVDGRDPGIALDRALKAISKFWPGASSAIDRTETLSPELLSQRNNNLNVMGVGEVAAMLGVTRQRASALVRSSGFPDPLAELGTGPVFYTPSVMRWSQTRKKSGRPRNPDPVRARRVNALLGAKGLSKTDINEWWNLRGAPGLGGQTPLQVWQSGEYERVENHADSISRHSKGTTS
jgi:hypothetical protein